MNVHSILHYCRGSHTSSEKEISLKSEKLARETRSQWRAVPHEGGVILEDFLVYIAGWELRNSSSTNQIEKFHDKLLSSVVSSLAEEKKRHSQFSRKTSYVCHKLPIAKHRMYNLKELQPC